MGLEGNFSGEKSMLGSKEFGMDTSSFSFPIRLCGEQAEQKLEGEKTEKEYHEN